MISKSHIIQFYKSIIFDVILIQKISPMHTVLVSGQKWKILSVKSRNFAVMKY